MNNLKNVISFEYMSVFKTKSFIFSLIFFVLASVLLGFLPGLINLGTMLFSNDEYTATQVAIIDNTGIFTNDILSDYLINFEFTTYTSNDLEYLTTYVEDGLYEMVIYFVSPTEHMVIFRNSLAGPSGLNEVIDLVWQQYQLNTFLNYGIDTTTTRDILNVDINTIFLPVGGAGFWIGYIVTFLIFFPLTFSGNSIGMSIINEKTSKTVEILFTSVKPVSLITGKVIASSLLILTQAFVILISGVIALQISSINLLTFISPEVLTTLANPLTYLYVFAFFLCSFITFAFMFACFAAMVRDIQEATSANTVPTLILVFSFYISLMVSANPSWLSPFLINILSYTPVISPLIMISRITAITVPTYQIIISLLINAVSTIVIAIISSKLYKKNIMAYGQKNSFFSRITKTIKAKS